MARRNERLYRIWCGIKCRTKNPNCKEYENYGGRGITICDEWDKSYDAFRDWSMKNGYSDALTIDRINNDEGYFPENCQWADFRAQANNKRNNHLITYKGITKTATQWAEEFGLNSQIITGRLKLGWSVEKALTTKKMREKTGYRFFTYDGKTQTLSQWARETGINKRTLSYRIDRLGWSIEKALTTPSSKRKK